MEKQLIIPPNLTHLASSLKEIEPTHETAQLVTYTLIATAIVGIFIYQYIKTQEKND